MGKYNTVNANCFDVESIDHSFTSTEALDTSVGFGRINNLYLHCAALTSVAYHRVA